MRIEGRRQKELDEGAEPEVVLDSFLDQVNVEQQQQSGPLKRVLTPSAKAAKHRRAKDKSGVRLCVGGSSTTKCVLTAISVTSGTR